MPHDPLYLLYLLSLLSLLSPRRRLPWRGVSLYSDASVYAGLRQHNRATLWPVTGVPRTRGGEMMYGLVSVVWSGCCTNQFDLTQSRKAANKSRK